MKQIVGRRIGWISPLFVLGAMLLLLLSGSTLGAQTVISGDIAGTVTDPTGAVISNAAVKSVNLGTGEVKTVKTGSAGDFRIGFLPPGHYSVTISAHGFQSAEIKTAVQIGQTAALNISLNVAKGSTTVEVLGTAIPLLQPENSDISTTISEQQVQELPNPGEDLTYYINLTQGVVMNTQGGYGNSEAFGLPATSNNFTINGAEDNDPFLNLNNSGPSNLLLGQDDVAEVSVVANAYSAQYGVLGGIQENITTRSGTNEFHGNVNYFWTNAFINANDFFNDQSGAPEPYANANQWAAAAGGPIKKNKLFFFFNYEGLDFETSPVDQTYIPTALYEQNPAGTVQANPIPPGSNAPAGSLGYTVTNPSVLGKDGACDDYTSSLYANGNGNECGFYNTMFKLWAGAPRASTATASGVQPAGTTALTSSTGVPLTYILPDGLTYSNVVTESPRDHLKEQLTTVRVDYTISPKDQAFIHYKYDYGVQPTYVDPINPVFNAQSKQPDDEGQLEETHIFTPNLVNQFILSGMWYSAYFLSDNAKTALSAFPYDLDMGDGSFSNLGNDEDAWPEGRNVTQYQINDDLSWTKGKNSMAFGVLFKRDDVTDADLGVLTVPLGYEFGPAEGAFSSFDYFSAGTMLEGIENFPQRSSEPIRLYNLGLYAQDQYKLKPNLQLTAGLRVEHNSNVVCVIDCFDYLPNSYENVTAGLSTPYNQILSTNLRTVFHNYQKITVDPRVGFTFSPQGDPKAVLRGGFGIFTDIFPGTIADSMLTNAPLNPEFVSLFNQDDPSVAGSFTGNLATTDSYFKTGFASGLSYNQLSTEDPNFTQPNVLNPDDSIHYPTYEEWSLQWQQQIGKYDSFQVGYVGNHGYHEPVEDNGVNASESGSAIPFSGLPANPALPSFDEVTEVGSVAISNYNGLLATYKHESAMATVSVNFTWSHAMDEISNGGVLPFGGNIISPIDPFNLRLQNYGNSDYDIRKNLDGYYLIHIPYFGGPRILTDKWDFGGNFFWHSGFPFSVTDSTATAEVNNTGSYGGTLLAVPVSANIPMHCGSSAANPTTPCLTASDFTDPTGFGGQRRNQFTGPGYFDIDFNILKGFKVPGTKIAMLQLGVQAYNALNHPNFANPVFDVSSAQFGQILSDVSPPTSVYGSFLGGDAAPRIVQLTARYTF